MKIIIEHEGHRSVVEDEMVVDICEAIDLVEEGLMDLIDNGGYTKVILNMEGIEYMSSSGFRACISTLRKLNAKDGVLKLCNIKPAVKRIFDVIELTSLFDIYETEDAALASFNG